MTQLVLGVAGAAIGGLIGGPTGASIGWAIGSGVGAYLNPTTQKGPRLEDLKAGRYEYGTPIPWIRGTVRTGGTVWWASNKREIKTTRRVSKSTKVTEFTYEMDMLIGLCDHDAEALLRVWCNGELVWSILDGATTATKNKSQNSPDLWERITFYTGSRTQLPDPTYEAAVGIGDAPAYRGRAYVFIEGLYLGASGSVPLLNFEVAYRASMSQGDLGLLSYMTGLNSDVNLVTELGPDMRMDLGGSFTPTGGMNGNGFVSVAGLGEISVATMQTDLYNGEAQKAWRLEVWAKLDAPYGAFELNCANGNQVDIAIGQLFVNSGQVVTRHITPSGSALANHGSLGSINDYPRADTWYHWAIEKLPDARPVFYTNAVTVGGNPMPTGIVFGWTDDFELAPTGVKLTNGSFAQVRFRWWDDPLDSELFSVGGYTPEDPLELPPYAYMQGSGLNQTVREVVEDLCDRAGLQPTDIDASDLSTITRPVRSLTLQDAASTRSALEVLASAYFFECNVSDKLRFFPRRTSVTALLAYDELGATEGGAGTQQEPLRLKFSSNVEIPSQVFVRYINVPNDYQVGTEQSERIVSDSQVTRIVDLPVGMLPAEAKGVADTILAQNLVSSVETEIEVSVRLLEIEPGDIVTLEGKDARPWRMRVLRREDSPGVIKLSLSGDDSGTLIETNITDENYTPVIDLTIYVQANLVVFDSPILRDQDDDAGVYAAAYLKDQDDQWRGGSLFRGFNDDNFQEVAPVTSTVFVGSAGIALGDFTGAGFDEVNSVEVTGTGELNNFTRDQIVNGTATPIKIGDEVLFYRTATLIDVGQNTYRLTGLLRGARGTEWAIGSHANGEQVVLLSTDIRRVTLAPGDVGVLYDYKLPANNTALDAVTTVQHASDGRGKKPFAPVDLRLSPGLDGSLNLTWSRRTRFAWSYMGAAGFQVPLGEVAEAYEVEVARTSPPGVLRTIPATTQSASYTSSMQAQDSVTPGEGLTLTVYQMGQLGRGYGASIGALGNAVSQAQIVSVVVGGVFQTGAELFVWLAGVRFAHTTVTGDVNIAGAAAALAAVIDASSDYTATSSGGTVIITGAVGRPFAASGGVLTSGSALQWTLTQAASPVREATQGRWITAFNPLAPNIPHPSSVFISVRRLSPAQFFVFTGTTIPGNRRSAAEQFPYIIQGIANAMGSANLSALGIFWQRSQFAAWGFDFYVDPDQQSNWEITIGTDRPNSILTSSSFNPGRTASAAVPQEIEVEIQGTPTAGWQYQVVLGGTVYDYTVAGGDDATDVAAGLAAEINGEVPPVYSASNTGAVLAVENLTANVPFSFGGTVFSTTLTLSVSVTQEVA